VPSAPEPPDSPAPPPPSGRPETPPAQAAGPEGSSGRTTDRRRGGDRRRPNAEPYYGPERRRGERRATGERRAVLIEQQAAKIARLTEALAGAVAARSWPRALDLAHALVELAPRVPLHRRRAFGIAVRRCLGREALAGLVDLAVRDGAEQGRVVAVLRWVGLEAADVMLHAICEGEVAGPRKFLHAALGAMPEAFPLVVRLLDSPAWHEARHAALILGRQRRVEAVPALKRRLDHPDERVRAAVIEALSRYPLTHVADALRRALAHPSPATRAVAAEAIARKRSASLAMPLAAALQHESDPAAWSAMVWALAAIGSAEACAGLAAIARARRSLLGQGGYSVEQRLEAVRALALVGSVTAQRALQRIAGEGDGPVRAAALAALEERKRKAGRAP